MWECGRFDPDGSGMLDMNEFVYVFPAQFFRTHGIVCDHPATATSCYLPSSAGRKKRRRPKPSGVRSCPKVSPPESSSNSIMRMLRLESRQRFHLLPG
jgi:hypothetical protein